MRRLRASAALLRASFLNLKGRAETRRSVARVFGGVFAVVFASLFAADEANAQTAEMQVFAPSGGTHDFAHVVLPNTFVGISFAGTADDVVGRLTMHGAQNAYFRYNGNPIQGIDPATGIRIIVGGMNRALLPGDVIGIEDRGSNGTVTVSVRVYDGGGGTNYFAFGEDPVTLTAAAELPAGSFFMDSVSFATTRMAATTNIGYEAPNCSAATVMPHPNGLMCRPTDKDDCTGTDVFHMDQCVANCPATFVDVGGECMPEANCDSATQRPNETGGCRPTERDDCTAAGEVFHIDRCLANCPDDFNDDDGDGNCTRTEEKADDAVQPQTAPARAESDVRDNAIVGVGGAAAVGVAAWLLSSGRLDALLFFSPDFGYTLTESGYSVRAGGRIDFRKARWHLYWTAGQESVNGDFGDFRYASGGEYKADFWTAAFSEKVSGKVVDYDVSLSANYSGGIWKLSPVYRLHSRFEEEEDGGLESETTSSLNLEGVLRYHRWTVRPSAGFQWREMDDFADNARFGISAVRNL